MRIEELPSPGPYSGAARLRVEMAKAISYSEIGQLHTPNKTPKSIIQLIAFLEASLSKAKELVVEEGQSESPNLTRRKARNSNKEQ